MLLEVEITMSEPVKHHKHAVLGYLQLNANVKTLKPQEMSLQTLLKITIHNM